MTALERYKKNAKENAMTPTKYTWIIDTVKGGTTGTVEEIARWQAEHQGAFAEVSCQWLFEGEKYEAIIDADAIDFDPDDIPGTVASLENELSQECDREGWERLPTPEWLVYSIDSVKEE